ncbi:MAG: nucleotidyltransferase domain-containing protein [Deltaproteobacteria bacterium]|nr:nucleotidyltransferase domain-containing protein [Deltaproteobacteria bacterium]
MATALELGPEGWKRFVEAFQSRVPISTSVEGQTERQRLLDSAREAARALKTEFGAARVVLFGSLAHQAWFEPSSDVDLAVEGLPAGAYWRAWRRAEGFFPGREVDVVEYEAASPSLRDSIDEEGLEL